MALQIRRFDFDGLQDFKAPPPALEIAVNHMLPEAVDDAPPPPPSFSESELKDARAAAYEEGRLSGVAEEAARQDAEAQNLAESAEKALKQLLQQAAALDNQYQQFKERQTQELGALVKLLVSKIAGDLVSLAPQERVQRLIDQCIGIFQRESRLIVNVHPDIMPAIEEKLRLVVEAHHITNRITLNANPSLGKADTRLEWQTGSAESSMATLWQEVESLIDSIDFTQLARQDDGQQPTEANNIQTDNNYQGEQDE